MLTSLRVRFAFGAVLELGALSSEALRLPEASEGIMGWSGLVVMVEVMFIDKSGGCCRRCRVCRARWAGRRRALFAGRSGRLARTRARGRTFNYCLTLMIKQQTQPDRPPAKLPAIHFVRRLDDSPTLLYAVLNGCNQFYNLFIFLKYYSSLIGSILDFI